MLEIDVNVMNDTMGFAVIDPVVTTPGIAKMSVILRGFLSTEKKDTIFETVTKTPIDFTFYDPTNP